MASFDTIPKGAKVQPSKFTVAIPEQKLQQMKQLVSLSPIGPETYENLQESREMVDFGISRKCLADAKAQWESRYDWRATEAHINSFPNFTSTVADDDGRNYTIHFVALFSTRADAIPIAFFHGWPGSFLEFLPILSLLKEKYPTADKLPYHIIVPSLPGWAFSDSPPKDRDWKAADTTRLMNKLLVGLGFGERGYVAQGGDIGSIVSQTLAAKYDACKAVHLNVLGVGPPEDGTEAEITEAEAVSLKRGADFQSAGLAFAVEHATRPSTIGLALSASPIALLAWIGEKFWMWTDAPPTTGAILDSISLYWLTDTFPTSLYTYRELWGPRVGKDAFGRNDMARKPFGLSWFPKELMNVPKSWIAAVGNLVWYKRHSAGGHFAAMERPRELLADVEEFVGQVWKA